MKKIMGINEKLRLVLRKGEDPDKMDIPTFKEIFLNCIGMWRKYTGEKALRVTLVGMELLDVVGDEVNLEDADFNLLKDIMTLDGGVNWPPYNSFIMGQGVKKLKDAEKEAEKK